MSNIKFNTTLTDTGFSYNRYNTDIKLKSTYGDFTLPAWSIENFDSNTIWKARYNLTANEDYTNLKEEQKELLRKEVFNSWAETIWSIIRQRIGLSVDLISFAKLDKEQQENIRLAIAQQINNWRINLPYEINNNVSRVSGNLQTTINASAFTTGFDILSQQTKQSITATGLDRYDYTELLEQCYREDSLLTEVLSNKERITFLEENKVENILPENVITRVEAINTFELTGKGYITKTEADNTYVKSLNISSITTGGYFENENKISDTTIIKSLKNTGSKELKIETSSDSITYSFLNNDNVERLYTFDRTGFRIDNENIPTTNSILSSINNNYYNKNDIDIKLNDVNDKITNEDNNIKEEIRNEITETYHKKTDTYSKTEADNLFYNQEYITANYYNKAEVDTKITSAQTAGQVDLSNYYNKNEADTLLTNYYDKANADLRLSTITANMVSKNSNEVQEIKSNTAAPLFIISGTPTQNSNNAARMEDIIKEVKRLLTTAVIEYDKIAKREFSDVNFDSNITTIENDEEELIIEIGSRQAIINLSNLDDFINLFTNTYYVRQPDGTDIQYDQLIRIWQNNDNSIRISSQISQQNLGPAGIGTSGARINNIKKVVIRKDSLRALVKELQVIE